MPTIEKVPNFQDQVRHKTADATGTVISKYPVDRACPLGKQLLDVRVSQSSVLYGTPAENWETVRTEEERW